MRKVVAISVFLLVLTAASSAMADTTVYCDYCGRAFNVDEGLYNFACPYCGYEYDSWHCSVCDAINFVPLAWDDYVCWNCGTTSDGWICWNCGEYNFVPRSWTTFYCWDCGAYNEK